MDDSYDTFWTIYYQMSGYAHTKNSIIIPVLFLDHVLFLTTASPNGLELLLIVSDLLFFMYLQEAFVKIVEQAKAYLETKGEVTAGLNLINNTNLEYFPPKHKAEIFRLKGDFFLKLNDSENANLAYSNAISLFKNLPKGWISWGNYCDMVYTIIFFMLLLSITVNLSFILIHHLL